MSKKITLEDIIEINKVYYKTQNYSQTARETGFSASTIKRYVQPDFIDPAAIEIVPFEKEIVEVTNIDWATATQLSEQELNGIKELWKEVSI